MHEDRIPTGDLDAALPGSPVIPLRRLHAYRIADGDPDVRGWKVFGADGRTIGEVDDLLVDTRALRVRYLEVALDLDLLEGTKAAGGPAGAGTASTSGLAPPLSATSAMGGLGPLTSETLVRATLSDEENRLTQEHHHGFGTRHVLIPIGFAQLDPEHDRVLVEKLSAAEAAGLPVYDGRDLDREYEVGLLPWFDRAWAHAPEREFYAHDLYDEDRFYGTRRRADRGEAIAESARAAGLEPAGAAPAGDRDRTVTGELDRAVDAPDRSVTRDHEEAALPSRGRS
ncbi:MAG TPA: PRC-barrel domain-containing protein [Thermoanaerobaculia bacterium]|jgi:hypothetical protein|nr:PRC-barrel domain-containing protein [Thermoanaerobaculia bacterium]